MLQNSSFPHNYRPQQLLSGQGCNNGFHSPQIQTPVSTSTPSNNQKQIVISTSQQLNYINHLQPQQQEQQQMYNPIYNQPSRAQQQSQQPNIYQPTAQQRTSSSNNIPNPNPNPIYAQQKQIVLSTSQQLNYIHHLQPQPQQQEQQQMYSPIYNQPPRIQQTQQPRTNQPVPQKTSSSNNYSPDTQCIPRNTVPVAACWSFSQSNQQIGEITLCELPDCRCKQNQPITPKFQLIYSGSNSGLQTPSYNQSSLSPLSQPSLETPSTLTLSTSSKSLSSSYQPSNHHQSNSTAKTELDKYCKENDLSAYSANMARKYLNTYASVFHERMLDSSYVPEEKTYVSEKTLTPTKFEKANFRKFEESSVYLESSLYQSDRNLNVLPSLDKRKPYNHYVYTKQNHSDSIERMRRNDDYSTQFEFFKGGGMDSFNISTSTSNTTTVLSDSTISQLTLPTCLGREQSLQRQDIVPSVDHLRVPSRVLDIEELMKLKKLED